MTSTSCRRIGATILALSLAFSVPALAQQTNGAAPQAPTNAGPQQGHGEWNDENFDRQDFREEMGQIRKEHEEIEDARDRLMDKCVNVSAEQAAQCQTERQTLKERSEKLHERMKALHEKMEAARKEHQEERQQRREEHHQGMNGAKAAPSAPATAPAGQ